MITFVFLGIYFFDSYLDKQKIIEKQRLEALNDIKKGIVKKKFGSGLIIFDENYNKRVKEIDSLQRKKYGFFVESTGCIIYEEDKYYNEAVDEYLQKRNGKNWENQYKKELALETKAANIHTSDVFYRKTPGIPAIAEKYNCPAVEMEAFALFANAKHLVKNASTILTVSDIIPTG